VTKVLVPVPHASRAARGALAGGAIRAVGRALARRAALASILLPLLAFGGCGSGQPQSPRWTAWTRCGLLSFGACPAGGSLYGVAMASPAEGWAVGAGILLHYSGGRWAALDNPPGNRGVYSVAMASPAEGWAVGGSILHYAGGHWAVFPSPLDTSRPPIDLTSVALASPTEGWAVGANGAIMHYADGQWSSAPSPTDTDLTSVAMASPSEGWAVGESTLLHYTDGHWSQVPLPAPLAEYGDFSYGLHSVAMASPAEGWAVGVGYAGFRGRAVILHYADGRWSQVPSPTDELLDGVALASPSEGWAVGYSGTILHYQDGM
jgi:photosystem II stability/assembly factor-like uncharacterized protein